MEKLKMNFDRNEQISDQNEQICISNIEKNVSVKNCSLWSKFIFNFSIKLTLLEKLQRIAGGRKILA